MEEYSGVVQGAFLWDHGMASDETWKAMREAFHQMSTRDKLAEKVVAETYGAWEGEE